MEHFCSAVALAFGEAQPGDTYTCGVRIECELHIILGHDSARVGAAWRYNRSAVVRRCLYGRIKYAYTYVGGGIGTKKGRLSSSLVTPEGFEPSTH